jgi:3-dehydroquinate synthase
MKIINVSTSKQYDVIIDRGILKDAGKIAGKVLDIETAVIITDDIVDGLYADALAHSLENSSIRVLKYVIKHGESSKNAENYINILNFLAAGQVTRKDAVFALGGGVVGDLAGFTASTYLRGIRFVQIPTTLLAAVDSSVGGKTAINLEHGKNLCGAFYQPELVICDLDLLKTLTPEHFRSGLAEIVKYAVIGDKSLFELLKLDIEPRLEDIVSRCVSMKRDIVSRDEHENSERKLLNLGHTVGHAIERLSGYKIAHGYAVATGMAYMTRAAVKMNICSGEACNEIIALLEKFELPTNAEFNADELWNTALSDKKRSAGNITIIVPEEIGKCRLADASISELKEIIKMGEC